VCRCDREERTVFDFPRSHCASTHEYCCPWDSSGNGSTGANDRRRASDVAGESEPRGRTHTSSDSHLFQPGDQRINPENTGYWQVDPAEGGSLVIYAIAVRTIFPGFFTRGAERESLVDTIRKLRKLLENDKGAATR